MNPETFPLFLQTDGDTVNTLANVIHLNPKKRYGLGLFGVHGKILSNKPNEILYLCCDIVSQAYVANVKLPCLDLIKGSQKTGTVSISTPKIMWVSVIRHKISTVRLYITNDKGELASLKSCLLSCKLLIIPFHETDKR